MFSYDCALFPDRPGMPGIPDIEEVGGDFVSLTWEKPSSDGGGRIIGYIVEKKDANYDSWTRFGYEFYSDVLSKYPNMLWKFSELLVRDVVYWYRTTCHIPTSAAI